MTDAPDAKTALVVEDEMLFRLEVRDLLEAKGYAVVEAGNAAQALERLDGTVTLMITDVRMPGTMDGLALAREVTRLRSDVAVVVVSAQVTPRPRPCPGTFPSSNAHSLKAASTPPSTGPCRRGPKADDDVDFLFGQTARGLDPTKGRIRFPFCRPRGR